MSKIEYIVTGGAGFIGSNIVKSLNKRGIEEILVVDHLGSSAKWQNLPGLKFIDWTAKDQFLSRLGSESLKGVKAVFHLGACSSTTETDADYLMANNTGFTRELCRWSLSIGARFIYASSAATYGDGSLGYSDNHETTPALAPLNMYGYSKHLFDLWALKEGIIDRIAGLKYFNVYGPGEYHKGDMRSVVHKAWRQILETGRVKLFRSHRSEFGDGEQLRDFIYVKDTVDVTLFFLDHPKINGLFNCGTGNARSWLDLTKAVFAAMSREPVIEFIDMPTHLRDKYQYYTQADMTKLIEAGYNRPFTTLEDGIKDYIKEHLRELRDS